MTQVLQLDEQQVSRLRDILDSALKKYGKSLETWNIESSFEIDSSDD